MLIHPTTVVSPSARIAKDVVIGPFCVVEDDASLGAGCQLASGVVVKRGTQIGSNNKIDVGAVLGGAPQHMAAGDEVGETVIGDGNVIREYVTIHRAFKAGATTRVGNGNMLMASSHIGHDSIVGDHNILANNVMLAGHVELGERNYLGGGAAFHQFCRVGSFTMVGGLAQVKRDVPPFVMVDGGTACLVGLNQVGLRRAGMSAGNRRLLKAAYRLAFRSGLPLDQKIEMLKVQFPDEPAKQLWAFLEGGSRGFLHDRRGSRRDADPTDSNNRDAADSAHDGSDDRTPVIIPFRRAA